MSFSNYLAAEVLDEVFGQAAMPAWANLYIGLSTTTVAEDGTNFTEPAAASGYYRATVANDKTTWSTATVADPSSVNNRIVITFGTASGNWGTLTDFGIFNGIDATATGLAFGVLTTPKTVANTDVVSFASGALTATLD